jgi:hypothetical protein
MNSNEEVKPPSGGREEVCAPLLPEATISRLKKMAPPPGPTEAQLASYATKRQKADDAKKLRDSVRREELRQIPKGDRTPEEQREFRRLEQRRYRAKEPKGDTLSMVATAEEFWSANRLLANGQKIRGWKEQEESVLDKLFWMNNGWACSPTDPDFVSLEEGLADLDAFIGEHGLIHDDSSVYQHYVLQDFRPSWGVWATKTIFDPIWETIEGFWRDERLGALCEENEPTAIYAKYGIRTALSAYAVRMFKFRIADHERSRLLGTWETHTAHEGKKCWLCNFERLHGTKS